MQTKQIYYDDQYKKNITAKVLSVEVNVSVASIILDKTIFYPEGGGQPSDQGIIKGRNGQIEVQQVLIRDGEIIHTGKITGSIKKGETVDLTLDWERRLKNMRVHSAGHIIHDAVVQLFSDLTPVEADHGKHPFIKYEGHLDQISSSIILEKANEIIKDDLPIKTEYTTLEELIKRAPWVPQNLPKNKPLRIMQIGNFSLIADGGTQLRKTSEVMQISQIEIKNEDKYTYIYYKVSDVVQNQNSQSLNQTTTQVYGSDDLINLKNQAIAQISMAKSATELESIRIDIFGKSGKLTSQIKNIKDTPPEQRKQMGLLINEVKVALENLLTEQKNSFKNSERLWFDATIPGKKVNLGHLHMVTRAIDEISRTFEKIGFTRARYPEVEWDYYAFGALNFPDNHPARDDWETFFIDSPNSKKYGPMLLTPHTSSGQIREMERTTPPIRMINIAKTYRRQSDVSHYPMFHQFEGLVVDKNISVVNLKGTLDYFAQSFFGKERKTRLRPYHFQFTEPSFEVDITCNVCNGRGCKLCKEGWLELGGAGMVHPNVLKSGGIDSKVYSGFAFGWGVERTYMMKSGLSVPDIRLLYSSDVRVLKQL